MSRTLLIAITVASSLLLASSAEAYRPSRRHITRSYGEAQAYLGGSAALTPTFDLSGGWLAGAGLGFNVSRSLGFAGGLVVGQRFALPDGAPLIAGYLHLDAEVMPRAAFFEPYGIVGAALVVAGNPDPEGEDWVNPGVRLGGGFDIWTNEGSGGRDFWTATIASLRAVYMPSFGRTEGPLPIHHQLLIEFQVKLHWVMTGNPLTW